MGAQPGKATNDPNGYLALAKQAAKDTEGTTFFFLKHLDGSGHEVEVNVNSEREGGDGQEIGLRYKTLIKADGAAVGNGRYGLLGRELAWTLGGDSVASVALGATAVQAHSAFIQASLPYITIEERYADEIERAVNCNFTSLTIEGEAGMPFKVTTNYVAGGTVYQRDISSTLTATRDNSRPHFYPGGSYVFDGFASYAKDVTKFRVEVVRNVDDSVQTTGLNRDDVIPLNLEVNFDATIKYTSRDFYQRVTYNGGSQVIADLPTGSFQMTTYTVGAAQAPGAAPSYIFQLNLPLLHWVDARVNKLDPDGKTMYLDIVGQSIKGATYPIWTTIHTDDPAAY